MVLTSKLRTAESVTPMHPDKICDQISDAVLDACLAEDPSSRVAVETAGGHGKIFITGEITTAAKLDIADVVKQLIPAGYETIINISQQSQEIARGVDIGGAGDQGIMNGYACMENDALIPQEFYLTRKLAQKIYRKYPFDGKTQISMNSLTDVTAVVASFQNTPGDELRELIAEFLDEQQLTAAKDMKVFCNPSGDWNVGGFDADAGLTGRKIAIDNYGPTIPIGGGAFSGKDPSKVDRSAAYMARKIAVDYLKAKGAKQVFVQIAYSIGVAEPVMALVNIDGKNEEVTGYDLTPKGIIAYLDLRKPLYLETARWGHFGNGFHWDQAK